MAGEMAGPQRDEIMAYAEEYMSFLNAAKTEREAVKVIRRMAEERGFEEISKKESLKPGIASTASIKTNPCFCSHRRGSVDLGISRCRSSYRRPRWIWKQNPLYEDSGFALFKTHYYGGIKISVDDDPSGSPRRRGSHRRNKKIDICIGEDESDPVFLVTDLLPHLSAARM